MFVDHTCEIFSNVYIKGTIPSTIKSLTCLTTFTVSSNKLAGISCIYTCGFCNASLHNLHIGIIPTGIGSLLNLANLYLFRNSFSGKLIMLLVYLNKYLVAFVLLLYILLHCFNTHIVFS